MNEKLHIGYVRVSTDEQVQSGYSIDFQRGRIEDKFKKMGMNDYLILVDDGVSGKSFNRPKIIRVIKWIEEDKAIMREMYDLYVVQYKSVDYIRTYSKKSGIDFRHPMARITNIIYQGYVNIPKDSNNRFDICEPIFTEEDVELMEIRSHHNKKHYGFKHEYKFRNKVIINGQVARHQKQRKKSGKEYNYYFINGGPFINKKTLIDLVTTKTADKYKEEVGKLENTIRDLAHELSIGSITKDEFDYKYKKIMEDNKPQKLKFEHIYVTTKYIDGEKELEYRIEQ